MTPEPGHSTELRTEITAALLFVVAAVALWLIDDPGWPSVTRMVILTGVYAVLRRVEFDVGEGRTAPLQLALVPLFLLLPPGLVPLLVGAAHLLARAPDIARGSVPPLRAVLAVADSWFTLPVALVLIAAGSPAPDELTVGVAAAALAAYVAGDMLVSFLRIAIGLRADPGEQLGLFGWMYLVDIGLAPIGWLAALAVQAVGIGAALAVLPLAALLVLFARERRARFENAAQLEDVLSESEERLRTIVRHSSDLIAILEEDGHIRMLTGDVEPVFGTAWEEALGTHIAAHVHPEDLRKLGSALSRAAAAPGGGAVEGEWRMSYPDGSWRHVEAVATNLLADTSVGGIVLTARDVDERKAFEEQLRHRAFHDSLTGLPNRALFYDRVEHALTRGGRDDRTVALLFIDLDAFKAVNDDHGHAVGDEVLVEAARRLEVGVRAADTLARLGGDEFGLLVEDATGINEVVQLADRLQDAFASPLSARGDAFRVGLSIGIAVSGPSDRAVDELLRRADLAMYAAKRAGRGRWEIYEPALEGVVSSGDTDAHAVTWFQRSDEQREEIVSLLERPDVLEIVFQPILDVRSGVISGYEALSRFHTSVERPPNAWFAQAHRVGLGPELEAVAIAAALRAPGRPLGCSVSVNLSPSSLLSDAVLAALPEKLAGVVLEITENERVSEDPAVREAIAALRARGVRLAVDDAGSGYAGIRQVMQLDPDVVKLDRSLVTGVDRDPGRAALVRSFVRYAAEMGTDVCAEGVESLSELERLASLDVTYCQGYAIAHPAKPWAGASPEAVEICLATYSASLAGPSSDDTASIDRRVEWLSDALSRAVGQEEALEPLMQPLARALRADAARLEHRGSHVAAGGEPAAVHALGRIGEQRRVARGEAVQLLSGDPDLDATLAALMTEAGLHSALLVPVPGDGVLALGSARVQPWTRGEIGRARVLANQLAATLAARGGV
jgi:diguanylate cyclase (GGDEF)-like protein/PAS domain S-box-containing protein